MANAAALSWVSTLPPETPLVCLWGWAAGGCLPGCRCRGTGLLSAGYLARHFAERAGISRGRPMTQPDDSGAPANDDAAMLARIEADPVGELCRVVKEAGLTMTLYGQPVDEETLRARALVSALDRLASTTAPPCCDCGTTTAARSACPFCAKVYCQPCAEKPYETCCDTEAT